jgi:asparagine synthase (glutamine-hydrolysing)
MFCGTAKIGASNKAVLRRLFGGGSRGLDVCYVRGEGRASVLILGDEANQTGVSRQANKRVFAAGSARLDDRPVHDHDAISEWTGANTDLDAIIQTYELHGLSFLARTNGDFGFVLWDETENRLLLATDRFATRPIFYREIRGGIVFASTPDLAAGDRKPVVTEWDVREFLLGGLGRLEENPYPDVYRLQPASLLIWTPRGHEIQSYWSLELRDPPKGDVEAQFRELFMNAVERRVRRGKTATLLSGGLDSTSVSLAASRLNESQGGALFPTISLVYPDFQELDESRYIDAALARGGIAPTKLTLPDHDPLEGVAEAQRGVGGLFFGAGQLKMRKLYGAARKLGCDVILDGHGGDEVVSYGLEYIVELARQGRWARLIPLAQTYTRLWDEDLLSLLHGLGRVAPKTFPNRVLRRAIRAAVERRKTSNSDISTIIGAAFRQRLGDGNQETPQNEWQASADDYARSVHRAKMQSHRNARAFEALDWTARAAGVEARFPFFDRELVEFCVNLPGDRKIRPGETRSILRRGLRELLPPEVRSRHDKAEFQGEVAAGLAMHHASLLDAIRLGIPALSHVIAQPAAAAAAENVQRHGRKATPRDAAITWRVATLVILLEQNADAFDLQF